MICGPTAVGKTSFAIRVAQHFITEIISADSRQCFKELNIGVAKPSAGELAAVHHYFINSHSVQEEVNAATFENYALASVEQIFKQHEVAVVVGGTGLYIKAFCEGMDEIPAIDPDLRAAIITDYTSNGLEWLQLQVQQNDPGYFINGEVQNPQRLMRALEVKRSTGKSIIDFQTHHKKQRNFNIVKIGLELTKEQLHQNINTRVNKMMEQGQLDEVRSLEQFKNLNALQTVGYKELFSHLLGETSLDHAVDAIKQNTRRYAKRQMTWFKKDEEVKWMKADAAISIEALYSPK